MKAIHILIVSFTYLTSFNQFINSNLSTENLFKLLIGQLIYNRLSALSRISSQGSVIFCKGSFLTTLFTMVNTNHIAPPPFSNSSLLPVTT